MSIYGKNDKLRKWRYTVQQMDLKIPGKDTIKIEKDRIVELSIVENYEALYFPLIKLSVVLDDSVYYKIIKNKNKCKIYFRMDKYYITQDSTDKSLKREFINDNFDIIMDENNEDLNASIKEAENHSDYTKVTKDDKNTIEDRWSKKLDVYLFKSTVLDGLKKHINVILKDCTVTDAVAYLCYTAGLKNVLMTRADNITKYEEFLIPPSSIISAIQYIDNYFGIYKLGSLIYFGINTTYILSFTGKCTAWKKKEKKETAIIIPKSNNKSHSYSLGSLQKEDNKGISYIVADYKTINIENESISNNYIKGNDITEVKLSTGDITDNKSTAESKSSNFTKTIENATANDMIASTYTNQASMQSVIIQVNTQDYDISAVAPNKKFSVLFEDTQYLKKYKGTYQLTSAYHTFLKEGEDFTLNSVLTVKKAAN